MSLPVQIMGVLNITPDSFSDGGFYNTVEKCRKHIKYLIDKGIQYLDVGAESTAPFNNSITQEEELLRYKNLFLPVVTDIPTLPSLSIDTYRPETFIEVFKSLKKTGISGKYYLE